MDMENKGWIKVEGIGNGLEHNTLYLRIQLNASIAPNSKFQRLLSHTFQPNHRILCIYSPSSLNSISLLCNILRKLLGDRDLRRKIMLRILFGRRNEYQREWRKIL